VVAIDRGVTVAFADSDGGRVDNPRFGDDLAPRLAKRQRQLQKKKKGSNNRAKAREKVAKVQRKLHRKREHFLHTWSHRYAKNHGVVVVEKLALRNMIRSARGTLEQPGVNVAAKSGLNRAMADIAMGRFGQMLRYKSEHCGGMVVEVEAAYSSQTCAACGHVDAASRQGVRFRCTACGHVDHADSNAAKVLKQRYEINIRRTGGEAACGGSPARGGPMKQEPKTVRVRTQALKKPQAKSPGLQAGDGLRTSPVHRAKSQGIIVQHR
jgi:putative transposase